MKKPLKYIDCDIFDEFSKMDLKVKTNISTLYEVMIKNQFDTSLMRKIQIPNNLI